MADRKFLMVAVALMLAALLVFVSVWATLTASLSEYCTRQEVQDIVDTTLIQIYD